MYFDGPVSLLHAFRCDSTTIEKYAGYSSRTVGGPRPRARLAITSGDGFTIHRMKRYDLILCKCMVILGRILGPLKRMLPANSKDNLCMHMHK